MCGRLACNQCRETYQKATCYYNESARDFVVPEWKDVPNKGKQFKPSCNLSPTDVSPILLSGNLLPDDAVSGRVLLPMMWGIIPPWHKGDYKSHGLSTNNCRIENIGSSKLYGPMMKQGKRCIVICDGFYEWQSTQNTKTKQPYFIYASQDSNIEIENQTNWLEGSYSSSSGWSGPKPLHMAGLFNIWQSPEGGEIYNYTVITKESKKNFSWLHHRVPAILTSPQHVQNWIDSSNIDMYEALKTLESGEDVDIQWHPVSTLVNKSTNKSSDCNKKIQIKKNTFLTSWLKKEPSTSKRDADANLKLNNDEPINKKIKQDDSSS